MPVSDVQHDLDNLTLTITADFAAPVERIWQVYADPRQLERVWGPPTYPATVVDHDLTPGPAARTRCASPASKRSARSCGSPLICASSCLRSSSRCSSAASQSASSAVRASMDFFRLASSSPISL